MLEGIRPPAAGSSERKWTDMAGEERTPLAALADAEIPAYLDAHSHLPGPRANLELVTEFADTASPDLVFRLAGDPDEFRRLCGTAALGRLLPADDGPVLALIDERARDESWRVREGVAIALQTLGDHAPETLRDVVAARASGPHPLIARAAVAGICEPRLLGDPATARAALHACGAATALLRETPEEHRRDKDVRTLRQALGYCWSVAVVGDPGEGLALFTALAADPDRDVQWIVRENQRKARLRRLLATSR
jgi:hypothetical protein